MFLSFGDDSKAFSAMYIKKSVAYSSFISSDKNAQTFRASVKKTVASSYLLFLSVAEFWNELLQLVDDLLCCSPFTRGKYILPYFCTALQDIISCVVSILTFSSSYLKLNSQSGGGVTKGEKIFCC